jgi:hypothetical protein
MSGKSGTYIPFTGLKPESYTGYGWENARDFLQDYFVDCF